MPEEPEYGLGSIAEGAEIPAPEVSYLPREPRSYRPPLALVGCGGISEMHLRAYRAAGYEVVALANPTRAKAEARRDEFFPDAKVYESHTELLRAHPEVEVVDVATHPDVRTPILEDCLRSGRHVLSQKPFVTDLETGERLAALAEEQGRRLAVNQNGRWAPHMSWMREAVRAKLVGEIACVDVTIHWDHSWVVGTLLDETPDLLLFDFGVHWFDFFHTLFPGRRVLSVSASTGHTTTQRSKQPMLAQAAVEFESGRATLALFGDNAHLQRDTTLVAGSAGTLLSSGPDLQHQELQLATAEGIARPTLEGDWFTTGFHGAMAELLCAIEEDREPPHSARDNLESLALAFAVRDQVRSPE